MNMIFVSFLSSDEHLDGISFCSFYVGCQLLSFTREQTVNMLTEITYFFATEYKARARAEPERLFDPSCIIYRRDGLIEALLESH